MIARRREYIIVSRDVLARLKAFGHAERGSTATEYGLIAAFVVATVIVALTQVRDGLAGLPFPALIAAFTDALAP